MLKKEVDDLFGHVTIDAQFYNSAIDKIDRVFNFIIISDDSSFKKGHFFDGERKFFSTNVFF